jgi:hypothetical protein
MNWSQAAAYAVLCFFIIAASIEFLSLFYWVLQPLGLYTESLAWTKSVAEFESQIFYAAAPLTPALFILFIFSWTARPILRILQVRRFRLRIGSREFSLTPSKSTPQQYSTRRWTAALILAFAMVAAGLLALYPYSPALNPNGHYIGADTVHYADYFLPSMANQTSIPETVAYTFSKFSDRPLSLLLMYSVYKATGLSTWTVAMFFPAILAPLTVLAVYYFSHEARLGQTATILAAVFTVFSYHLTAGILGGFLSNWIALAGVYVFSGLLMRAARLNSWLYGCLATAVAVLLLFTHSVTWGMLIGVIAVYALIQVLQGLGRKGFFPSWELKLCIMILGVNFAANLLRNYILSFGSRVEVLNVAQAELSLQNLASFWSTTNYTFQFYFSRTFLNPFIIFLSLIGALIAIMKKDQTHAYLASWLVAAAVPFTLGDLVVKARILNNLPIAVFAANGLFAVLSSLRNAEKPKQYRRLCLTVIITVILLGLNYALRLLFAFSRVNFS